MRLIDADLMIANGFKNKTIEVRTEDIIERHEKVVKLLFRDAVDFINKQPTVDAVERKKGKWIKISITDDGYAINYRCSCCKGDDVKYPWKYCPNCGADMRGEANVSLQVAEKSATFCEILT